jgi:hypothetical protein
MPQKDKKIKSANDNFKSISPTQELQFHDLIQNSGISSTAKSLGYWIARWTNGDATHPFAGYAWAGREKLAEKIGRKRKATVTEAMSELVAANLVIVKRRPNATSLVRPNWDLLNQNSDVRKTVLPEVRKSGHPDVRKTVPYSTDPYRADLDSADPKEKIHGSDKSSRESDSNPSDADRASRSTGKYTNLELGRFIAKVHRFWPGASDDAEYQPGEDTHRGAFFALHRLTKAGHSLERIELAAKAFLDDISEYDQWPPSFARFLNNYALDYLEPDGEWFIPFETDKPVEQDNQPVKRKAAVGDDVHYDEDPPF